MELDEIDSKEIDGEELFFCDTCNQFLMEYDEMFHMLECLTCGTLITFDQEEES